MLRKVVVSFGQSNVTSLVERFSRFHGAAEKPKQAHETGPRQDPESGARLASPGSEILRL